MAILQINALCMKINMKKIEDNDSEFLPNYDFNIPALEQVSSYYSNPQQNIFARIVSNEETVIILMEDK